MTSAFCFHWWTWTLRSAVLILVLQTSCENAKQSISAIMFRLKSTTAEPNSKCGSIQWFVSHNHLNIKRTRTANNCIMIFSNCAVLKMTSGIRPVLCQPWLRENKWCQWAWPGKCKCLLESHSCHFIIWRHLSVSSSTSHALPPWWHSTHPWFDVTWRRRDDEWRRGVGGIVIRQHHPVRSCVLSTTFVLFVSSQISRLIFPIASRFGTIKRGVVKNHFDQHLPRCNKVKGKKNNQESWHHNGGHILSLRWMWRTRHMPKHICHV